jgi:predicted deacylase
VIDYHGGDIDENLRPYAYWTKTGRAAQDAASRALVLAFGLDHIIISADRPADPAASRYLENTATTRGKPSITVEAGHSGTVEPDDVAVLVNGTLSVMRHLKMLGGAPVPVEHPVWIDHLADVASDHQGIFYPVVRPGTYAEAGMTLGYVTDFVGRKLGDLRAKEPGVVLYVRAVPSVGKGDTIASVGVVGKAP